MTDLYAATMTALDACPLVPVLTIHDASTAGALATALLESGLTVAEVTMRTPAALDAITEMKKAAPGLIVGAGTILSAQDLNAALAAGSDFIVTPATSEKLLPALQQCSIPVFPGVATPSEALTLYDHGFTYLKFFPAESNGGVKALKSMAPPLPMIKFMPTGGINGNSAPDYLALANVVAVGGSWMVDQSAMDNHDFLAVTEAAKKAVSAIKT